MTTLDHFDRGLPTHRRNLTLEAAYAGFLRVARDEELQRFRQDADARLLQTRLLDLARNEEARGDVALFEFGVAR